MHPKSYLCQLKTRPLLGTSLLEGMDAPNAIILCASVHDSHGDEIIASFDYDFIRSSPEVSILILLLIARSFAGILI